MQDPLEEMPEPQQAKLQIKFLIVGAGIAGLACAAALRRVGHHVVVLEQDSAIRTQNSGGIRMAPNLTKILYHWGLCEQLKQIGSVSQAIDLNLFETGEVLGTHVWDEELIREARGEFIMGHHADLRHLLFEAAISYGAEIRFNSRVQSLDPEAGTVTLTNGEVLSGNVIIGADGATGKSRQLLLDYEEPKHVMNLYSTTIPKAEIMKDEELASYLYNRQYTSLFSWFGNKRLSLGYSLGGEKDFALLLYCPLDEQERHWDDKAPLKYMQKILDSGEPRLRKLGALAAPPSCVPVLEFETLEDWVHESGRMLLIGEAAHPHPPASIQVTAMAIEDGAVLAKLFSHLRNEDQISDFLFAFTELRQPRCATTQRKEHGDVKFMSSPPGPVQEARDSSMRFKRDAGLSALDATEGVEESAEWAEIKYLFGYDAEDEADDWWQEWGMLRLRANGNDIPFEPLGNVVVEQQVGGR